MGWWWGHLDEPNARAGRRVFVGVDEPGSDAREEKSEEGHDEKEDHHVGVGQSRHHRVVPRTQALTLLSSADELQGK